MSATTTSLAHAPNKLSYFNKNLKVNRLINYTVIFLEFTASNKGNRFIFTSKHLYPL